MLAETGSDAIVWFVVAALTMILGAFLTFMANANRSQRGTRSVAYWTGYALAVALTALIATAVVVGTFALVRWAV